MLVPLDTTSALSGFPQLSPVDYFAAASLPALIFRLKPMGCIRLIFRYFSVLAIAGFGSFLLYAFVSADIQNGSIRDPLRWIEFIYFCFVGFLATHEGDPQQYRESLTNTLAIIGLWVSSLAIAQFALSGGYAFKAYATFGHRNGLAAFLSLCLPACAANLANNNLFWTSVRKIASFIILCAFVVSYSRGAWMGIAVGVLFVLWGLRKESMLDLPNFRNALLLTLIFIGPLSVLVIMRYPQRGILSTSQRPLYWQATKDILERKPLMGIGPGNYESDLPLYLSPPLKDFFQNEITGKGHMDFWQHMHSLYLQILVVYGFVGFTLWLSGLLGLIIPAIRSTFLRPSGLKAFFLISVVAFLVHNSVDMMIVTSLDIVFAFLLTATIDPPDKNPT